ncbi:MAG: glycoside hydrolase family 2 [Dysgonamonadaceae bacterium]|jgi:mannosylglycoprotein endo-beta-mannosidase|nr:glycoside hydrolase family 2 [Dysgonamonadaceae bacterium]
MKRTIIILFNVLSIYCSIAQEVFKERDFNCILRSEDGHHGAFVWKMKKAGDITARQEDISTPKISTDDWMRAIVPGTVLNSLVYNNVYPEPYFGLNNNLKAGLIPDLYHAGRDFYTCWFRTEFDLDKTRHEGKKIWLQIDGINYRAEIWLNGNMVGNISGMFFRDKINITDYAVPDGKNILAIKTYPVDVPGTMMHKGDKAFGATGEFQNGGNGEIGKNVTMLLTVGWDFYYLDGIRDRNTGIWKDISIYTTGKVTLQHPFVKSELSKPDYDIARQTVSVEVFFPDVLRQNETVSAKIIGEIAGENIKFEKEVSLFRNEVKEVVFTPEDYPQLIIRNPRLWWPVNKGRQELYDIVFKVETDGVITDSITSRFGIREITSDRNTPDKSRIFRVNGKPVFIKGANWLPEAMLRNSEDRTYAELRYSAQSGINLIRSWAGGITESDYFFQLCDELGILVWQEFWMTGDTKHPYDEGLYKKNVLSTVKRIRNHASLAYYVCSNESTEMPDMKELLMKSDGTRGYQMESESDGIHDGSPYKQVNIMCHYENTASGRGSRIDGFNPEYGAPCLPTVECLREMIPEKDLWPINKTVWDYSDGNGFHQMTSLYTDMVNEYGTSESIDEFSTKAQFVGALNYKSIWEVWNYNKMHYGDRFCSGFLYWYHNSPVRQVAGRMWDWSLEPTAALYAAQNACEPLHPQFDYLKNTVSVINDYYRAFSGYKISAEVYDLNMKKVFYREELIPEIPEDGAVNDIFKIEFPEAVTNVHFIKLRLFDEKGRQVGDNFYWRSNSRYEGKTTLTGPATAGFQDINKLPGTNIRVQYKSKIENGKHFIDLNLKNTGKALSFFTRIQWLDKNGSPVRPSFYSNNFLNLLPGETVSVSIETDMKFLAGDKYSLVVKGFNIREQRFGINIR